MTDFSFDIHVLRGQMANALCDSPEQASWVLAEITNSLSPNDIAEFCDSWDQSAGDVSAFYQELAEKIKGEAI